MDFINSLYEYIEVIIYEGQTVGGNQRFLIWERQKGWIVNDVCCVRCERSMQTENERWYGKSHIVICAGSSFDIFYVCERTLFWEHIFRWIRITKNTIFNDRICTKRSIVRREKRHSQALTVQRNTVANPQALLTATIHFIQLNGNVFTANIR